jgi:hypothetical protein
LNERLGVVAIYNLNPKQIFRCLLSKVSDRFKPPSISSHRVKPMAECSAIDLV